MFKELFDIILSIAMVFGWIGQKMLTRSNCIAAKMTGH